jgi:hypothetical protein
VSSGGEINDNGQVYEANGTAVTMGLNGTINVHSGAFWDIEDDSGISQTGASTIYNLGVFEKTSGAGISLIAGRFYNEGKIAVSSGTLEFQYNVYENNGSDQAEIVGSSTLEFDRLAQLSSLDFNGRGGTLALLQPANFSGEIENFQHGDTIHLLQAWYETNSHYFGGMTTLTIEHSGVFKSFEFAGNLNFNVAPGAITTITRA